MHSNARSCISVSSFSRFKPKKELQLSLPYCTLQAMKWAKLLHSEILCDVIIVLDAKR